MGNEQRGEAGGTDERRPIPVVIQPGVIGEDTPVKLKVLVGVLASGITLLGTLGCGIWWAATVSEKLSTILVQNAAIVANEAATAKQISDLDGRLKDQESWRRMIDQQGDPAGRVRDENLQNQVNQMRHDLDVWQAKLKP